MTKSEFLKPLQVNASTKTNSSNEEKIEKVKNNEKFQANNCT